MLSEDTILIEAPQSVVWAVTIDVENWPRWAPACQSVERCEQGSFAVGSAALIKQRGLPPAKWVVTSLTPGENFTWETRIRGIHMISTHSLSTHQASTESLLRLEMHGLIARSLWPLTKRLVRAALAKENAGLKRQCEEPCQ